MPETRSGSGPRAPVFELPGALLRDIEMFDENLKVGVDFVDADHARLIDLLDQVEAALARANRRAVARLLRGFLAAFDRHFETENRLLDDLGRPDLDRRHSEFITARSMMLAHPIDAGDSEQAARIVEFARAWLYDHIVRQDGTIGAALAAARPRRSRFALLDRIPLRWRMAIMGLLPLVVMIGLTALSVGNLADNLRAADLMRSVVHLESGITDLVFELRQESNRAIMVVGSPRLDRKALKEQVARSDAALEAFRATAARIRGEVQDRAVIGSLDEAESSLSLLGRARSDVHAGSFDVYSTIEYYDTAIVDLMGVVPGLTRKLTPSEITRRVDAYVFLMRALASGGAELTLGTSLLSGVTVNILTRDPRRMIELAAEQDSLGRTFEILAGPPVSDGFAAAASISPMLANARRSIVEGDVARLTAAEWSDTAGLRIDRIRAVEKAFIGTVETEVAAFADQTWRHAMLLGGGILAAISLSLVLTLRIGWTVLPPLARLGAALRRLADGERLVALPDTGGRDEIADLARAFVFLRDRLVQGDLIEAKRGTENADRLRTALDGLPGIVFRIAKTDGGAPRVVAASSKLRHLTGLKDEDVLDRPLGSVMRVCVDPEDRVALLHVLRRVGRGPLDFEFRLRRPLNGRVRWMRVLATAVETGDGSIWDGVALDITASKEAEREQARLRDELDRLHRAQTANRIAGGLGHDLSHLWWPLLESTEELSKALPRDSGLLVHLNKVRATALRLRSLSEQLNVIDAQGRSPEPIAIVDRLERRIEALKHDLVPGPMLDTTFAVERPAIFADAETVDLMLTNLVAHLTETLGTEPGTVTVATEITQGEAGSRHLRITVRDDRSPLASHALARVLRMRAGRVRSSRGEDLSLAIVRTVVDRLRGWVDAGRTPDGESILEISLPIWEGRSDNVVRLERPASWS